MATKYKTVVTTAGATKFAAALTTGGKKVNITTMAVGDGGGTLPEPNAGQTKLVNEVWRQTLNKISQDNKYKNYVVAELVIPPETGGFWLREMGLYDDTGTLVAVGNMAESYKPKLEEGSGRAQTLRMVIILSDVASIDLSIDSTTVMASQDYVDGKILDHEQSRRHPDATLTDKGFTQLSSAINSVAENQAATPRAVKMVNDDLTGVKNSLGTASAKDVVTSLSDTTAGRVPVVGWMGLGATSPAAVSDANTITANGFYRLAAEGLNIPVGRAPTILLHCQYDVNAANQIAWRAAYPDGPMYHRCKKDGVWSGWIPFIDASGGTINGGLTLKGGSQALTLQPANAGTANFIMANDSTGANQWYIGKNSASDNNLAIFNYAGGNGINFYANGLMQISSGNGKSINFTSDILIPSGAWVADQQTGIVAGSDAAGFSSNNLMINSWNGIGFYCTLTGGEGVTGYINTRTGRLEMKEQIIPGNYANFDSRYLNAKNGVTSIRLGSRVGYSVGGSAEEYANGYVLTAGGDFGASDGYYIARPLQYYTVGSGWVTVAYA